MRDLSRLLKPRSVAVFGGAWAAEVIKQLRAFGYEGAIWPVHPHKREIEGVAAFASLDALPGPPDAAFIGVNRHETIRLVAELRRRGAGGAVCFASGFAETGPEGAALQTELARAAGDMPLLGPNAYGFINAFDRALLWPDLHGCSPVERGVALIAQSSNIAINLTMARRALPIGYVICLGNQAQTDQADAIEAVARDPRVSVIALHIEAIANAPRFAAAVALARAEGKTLVALRAGRSEGSRAMVQSHTASLAGAAAVGAAFLKRIGVAEVDTIPELLEAAKLLHVLGPLSDEGVVTLSCSGGEASLVADLADRLGVKLTSFTPERVAAIRATVNPLVTISNPFDYHTFDWGAGERLERTFTEVMRSRAGLTALVLDWPKAELGPAPGWDIALDAFTAAAQTTGAKAAVVATVPECLPEDRAERLLAAGIAPMQGLSEMLVAARAARGLGPSPRAGVRGNEVSPRGGRRPDEGSPAERMRAAEVKPPSAQMSEPDLTPRATPHPAFGHLLPQGEKGVFLSRLLDEAEGKARLAAFGVPVPEGVVCLTRAAALAAAARLSPVAMKAVGETLAHKTELGAVKLAILTPEAAGQAYDELARLSPRVLVERMAEGAVCELIVGATRDPAVGLHLMIGAGGVLAELISESAILMLPTDKAEISTALATLKIDKLLNGYRGKAAADRAAVVETIARIADFVVAHAGSLEELDVNPLIATRDGAVAVDVLLKLRDAP